MKTYRKLLATNAIFLAILTSFFPPTASGRIIVNTINPQATIANNGRRLIVTGPIRTDVVQPIFLTVTVTQRTTGAIAEGIATLIGTGTDQQWEIHASTVGSNVFEEGAAIAVAVGKTTLNGRADDAHQWLVNITLVR